MCVCVLGTGGTQQDREDREAEEVTESVSGSPTAGLWILYLYSGPPALLTDALMKDKTRAGRQTQADAHTHTRTLQGENGRKTQLLKKRSLYSM